MPFVVIESDAQETKHFHFLISTGFALSGHRMLLSSRGKGRTFPLYAARPERVNENHQPARGDPVPGGCTLSSASVA
jgi:hypothetical protein